MDSNKMIKKSVFGGFNKDDVISVIEQLQKENYGLKNELAKAKNDRSEAVRLENELYEKNSIIQKLKTENGELKEKNNLFSLELEAEKANSKDCSDKLNSCKAGIADIEQKFEALREKYDKYGDSEKYSAQVKESINKSSQEAKKYFADIIDKITEATERLKESSNRFSETANSITADMEDFKNKISEIMSDIPNGESDENI